MKIEKLSLALPQEMADLVRGAVESGEYASLSEVIYHALRDWEAKRSLEQREIERIRALLVEAEESPVVPWPGAEGVLAEIHRRVGRVSGE